MVYEAAAQPGGRATLREVGLPAAVVLGVVGLCGALLPLALQVPALPATSVAYWVLVGYLLTAAVALGVATASIGDRALPTALTSGDRREAAIVLACALGGLGYLVGLAVFQAPVLLGKPIVPPGVTTTVSQALTLLLLVSAYALCGGASAGLALHLWLRRRRLPRWVARFSSGGAAVAAVLAAIALWQHQNHDAALGPLQLFGLGALVLLPVGVWVGGRLLPHEGSP